ncbi:MAG TPA: phosphotransferase, partial [Gemmatimonadaceae bacterium]|nr:phosphotransferase [Gemmatimonadaceae bacterium]
MAREHFGTDGIASQLTSERDQNFRIERADGTSIVLKIANAREERSLLEAQHSALAHVASHIDITPRVLPAASGESLVRVASTDGKEHLAWAVSWLPGRPFALAAHRSASLLENFGRGIGTLSAALADFDTPAIHRDFYWNLANGRAMVSRHRALVSDPELGGAVDTLVATFDARTAPLLDSLPRAAVHGDLNDRNVLVGGGSDVEMRDQSVTGIVDFGDMTHSFRIADLAIAIAYAILGSSDPLGVAAPIVRGYRETMVIADPELAALFGLVAMRLCTSVCIAADQQRQRPDNDYLGVSQLAIAHMLPLLAGIPFSLAEAVFREAAGVVIVPAAARVADFLARSGSIAPVLAIDPQREP